MAKKSCKKLLAPKPRSFWTIISPDGAYLYHDRNGIPELFALRREAESQNLGRLNGDRVIKVTLYHPINNFRRRR